MKITENSASESELAVQFKTLAIEIFKTLSQPDEYREGKRIEYLNKIYTADTAEIAHNIDHNIVNILGKPHQKRYFE